MRNLRRRALPVLAIMLLCSALSVTAFATGEEAAEVSRFYQTIWSLLPPVVAIVLALITKEVYSSLFVGILVGSIFASGGSIATTVDHVTNTGLIAAISGTAGIFLFL